MEIQILHDKSIIFNFLRSNPELQVYCIGDLDDFFWPKTIWYALVENEQILAIALLYTGMDTPTLLSFYDKNPDYSKALLTKIKSMLPTRFYAHLSPGLLDTFGKEKVLDYYGFNCKMALRKTPDPVNDSNIRRLSTLDLSAIQEFYSVAYPHNWFDKRMLETHKYFGYFVGNRQVGVAGIHVYSSQYKVAALGNIATHPDYRGKQIGFKLTSLLCADLLETVDFIGLNVKSDNHYALRCYQKIGFEIIGEYDECLINNT